MPKDRNKNHPKSSSNTQPSADKRLSSQKRNYGDAIPSIIPRQTTTTTPPASTDTDTDPKTMQPSFTPSDKGTESDPETRGTVESTLAEGDVAAAVERKGDRSRAQAGAHSGPVGSARGPGYPGFGEERDLAAEMPRKEREHEEVLRERETRAGSRERGREYVGEGGEGLAEREKVRREKLRRDREVDVSKAVREGTGNVVVGK